MKSRSPKLQNNVELPFNWKMSYTRDESERWAKVSFEWYKQLLGFLRRFTNLIYFILSFIVSENGSENMRFFVCLAMIWWVLFSGRKILGPIHGVWSKQRYIQQVPRCGRIDCPISHLCIHWWLQSKQSIVLDLDRIVWLILQFYPHLRIRLWSASEINRKIVSKLYRIQIILFIFIEAT